ncbi:glycosyltransferase [Chryseobacterium lactis]|uniref:Glycosyltransferase n=2 Tax=Chryseobacterium lactis TaxID=1241981 RepID=A0A3G6RKL0_CHRLC|nr:glycosyltransferase family 2 protein [Chryseobacterium lactis]AZA80510.1 glycosyltransferase [Chryseobacterium lactis]AZB05512.1 glycosyltransferase [Chryseobacterium lactis]PNW11439.1 glycosyltransferase [Chryseobacterium lactis]
MNLDQSYSIVIPLYNEEENVSLLIDAIEGIMGGFRYELILVDDFSTDRTVKIIKDIAAFHVVLIELKKNYGQSSALMAGIDYASGDYIITMDGDLQNDPSDIPMMINNINENGYDLVVGKRRKRQDNLLKTFPSKIANFIIRTTTKLNVTDHGCALKIFTRETAKKLDLYGESHRFITLHAYINGARIAEVPIKHRARQFGVSKYGIGRTTKVINDLILLLFNQKYLPKPIYLFGNIGIATFIAGILINTYLFIEKLMGYPIGGRPLLILGILLVFVGIQLFTTGIIIDLLMKTYYESQKKRPFNIRNVSVF